MQTGANPKNPSSIAQKNILRRWAVSPLIRSNFTGFAFFTVTDLTL